MNAFEIKKENKAVYIVNNTACHIDGEPFTYQQGDEIDAELLCQELNALFGYKTSLQNIMTIIHNIKYNNWEWSDLNDYVYKGISLDALYSKYDDLYKEILESQKGDNDV